MRLGVQVLVKLGKQIDWEALCSGLYLVVDDEIEKVETRVEMCLAGGIDERGVSHAICRKRAGCELRQGAISRAARAFSGNREGTRSGRSCCSGLDLKSACLKQSVGIVPVL